MIFRVLYQDSDLVAIDKPAGFHVHPPENPRFQISSQTNCLSLLKRQLGTYLYPVHRLDRATSGVLIFALNPNSAQSICQAFQERRIKKSYFCVVRGWIPLEGIVSRPLKKQISHDKEESFLGQESQEATTVFQRLAQIELNEAVGKYPTSRYSLVRVEPITGRRHQIRRHLNHLAHPIVGDTVYGDGAHNRFFREKLKLPSLMLKAYSLEFSHPTSGQLVQLVSRWNGKWHQIFDLFGICPFESAQKLPVDSFSFSKEPA